MLYIVAAEGDTLDSRISKRFGHSKFHMVIDDETYDIKAVTGDVENMPKHGTGRFQEERIVGIIAGNVGPHAFDDITASGWKVYIVRSKTVREAMEMVKNGNVIPSTEPTMKKSVHDHSGQGMGHHGHHGNKSFRKRNRF